MLINLLWPEDTIYTWELEAWLLLPPYVAGGKTLTSEAPPCRQRRRSQGKRDHAKGTPATLSSLGLTPGTPAMLAIQRSLTYFICQRLAQKRWSGVKFELSGATVQVLLPCQRISKSHTSNSQACQHCLALSKSQWRGQGEGELKIQDRLLRPWADVAPGDTHVVVGGDSDLLLMALLGGVPGVQVLIPSHCVQAGKIVDMQLLWMQDEEEVFRCTSALHIRFACRPTQAGFPLVGYAGSGWHSQRHEQSLHKVHRPDLERHVPGVSYVHLRQGPHSAVRAVAGGQRYSSTAAHRGAATYPKLAWLQHLSAARFVAPPLSLPPC